MKNKVRVFQDKACKKHWKQELTVKTFVHCTEQTETYKMRLFESKISFCKRAGTVSVNQYLKRVRLVAIATILSWVNYFLFMSAVAHNNLSPPYSNKLFVIVSSLTLPSLHTACSDNYQLPPLAMQTIICNDSPTSANLRHALLYQCTEQSVSCYQFIKMNCAQFFFLYMLQRND